METYRDRERARGDEATERAAAALARHAVVTAVTTAAGTISRSATQTSWAIDTARRLLRHQGGAPELADLLTDDDVLWLLLNGWNPRSRALTPPPRRRRLTPS